MYVNTSVDHVTKNHDRTIGVLGDDSGTAYTASLKELSQTVSNAPAVREWLVATNHDVCGAVKLLVPTVDKGKPKLNSRWTTLCADKELDKHRVDNESDTLHVCVLVQPRGCEGAAAGGRAAVHSHKAVRRKRVKLVKALGVFVAGQGVQPDDNPMFLTATKGKANTWGHLDAEVELQSGNHGGLHRVVQMLRAKLQAQNILVPRHPMLYIASNANNWSCTGREWTKPSPRPPRSNKNNCN